MGNRAGGRALLTTLLLRLFLLLAGTQFWNYRRKFQIYLILVFVAFAYAAARSIAWQMWSTLVFFQVCILITDFMFFNEGDFYFDPHLDVSRWCSRLHCGLCGRESLHRP